MEPNNTQHKSFLWPLDFEPFTWHTIYGEQCPSFVTEENKEAWRRYLKKVIKKHLKEEVMNTSEFRDIELQIKEEKLLRIKWDEKRKWSMEKQRYRAKMERPRINYIPKGLSVNYEEEYSKYLMQEVCFEPRDNDDFKVLLRLLERWYKKSIPQILEKNRPDAAYAIAMTLCKHIPLLINRDDIQELVGEYKRRIGKLIFDSYQLRKVFENLRLNSLYDLFGSPCRGQKRCSNRFAIRLADHQRSTPCSKLRFFCGMNRLAEELLMGTQGHDAGRLLHATVASFRV